MKKLLICLLATTLILSLSACSLLNPPSNSPDSPPSETTDPTSYPIMLYLPNDTADGFVTQAAETDGTAADIIALLVAEHALPMGSAVLDFAIDGAGGPRVDMNNAFGQAVRSTGTTGEYLLLGSLVNTLLSYFGLSEITLTVEGSVLETGHEVYSYPLHFFANQTANTGTALYGSLELAWQRLEGFWFNKTERVFVEFFYQGNSPAFLTGLFESEAGSNGEVQTYATTGDGVFEITVYFPPYSYSEVQFADYYSSMLVDMSHVDLDNTILMRNSNDTLDNWMHLSYGGSTFEEAYAAFYR